MVDRGFFPQMVTTWLPGVDYQENEIVQLHAARFRATKVIQIKRPTDLKVTRSPHFNLGKNTMQKQDYNSNQQSTADHLITSRKKFIFLRNPLATNTTSLKHTNKETPKKSINPTPRGHSSFKSLETSSDPTQS